MAVTKTVTGNGGRNHHTFTFMATETATSNTAHASTLSVYVLYTKS